MAMKVREVDESAPFLDRRGIITFVTPKEGICEFDEKEKRIVVAQKYENEKMDLYGCTYCYHAPTNQIFIFDEYGKLFIYNASTKQWKTRDLNVGIGNYACCVCLVDSTKSELLVFGYIREETGEMSITLSEDVSSIVVAYFGHRERIHILGGDENKHHLIYDIESETLDKSGLEFEQEYQHASITADAQRNTIYFIGGEYGSKPSSSMYEIAVNENGSNIKHIHGMPKALCSFGCIFDDPYIFIFGGYDVDGYGTNDIYSFHFHTHEWTKLPIQTQFEGECHAILARDRKTVHLFERDGATHHSIVLGDLLPSSFWSCSKCTLSNAKTRTRCQLCGTSKPASTDHDLSALFDTNLHLQQTIQSMQNQVSDFSTAKAKDTQLKRVRDQQHQDGMDMSKTRFAEWLTNTVQLEQYLAMFREHQCDDIRMVRFLDEDTLRGIIGTGFAQKVHCKFMLEQVAELERARSEFTSMVQNNAILRRCAARFKDQCILTMEHVENDIGNKQELATLLGNTPADEHELNAVWSALFND